MATDAFSAAAPSWPADAVERRPVAALLPNARNTRTHSEAQIGQIAASIRQWGWTMPVLVDDGGSIIAGHGRVLAAQRLGIGEVPTMVARGWSEAQKRAYLIADNKLTDNGGWDDALLRVELADLQALGFDALLTGFSATEIKGLGTVGKTDPDELPLPPDPDKAIAKPGDAWICGDHRIVCGDATDRATVALALGGATPHLMVTDPPYGVNYDPTWRATAGVNSNPDKQGSVENDGCADWRAAWVLFPGDVAYCWHAGRFASIVQASLEASGFAVRSQIIWAKDRFALSRGDYHWQHEPCWYAVRDKKLGHWAGDRSQTTLWQIPAREDKGHGHSTQKPVECMKRPIENNSQPGDAVYDPFLGSGTTIIASEMTGRACRAIEINPVYVDVAVMRWQNFTGREAARDGVAFARLTEELPDGQTWISASADSAETVARQSG
jgi:DNA modification methylase